MAEFQEVMKQKQRMCKSYKGACRKCGISSDNNGENIGCGSFMLDYPQETEEIVMKWAEEHPIKTNADKFKEVFGHELEKTMRGCAGIKCPNPVGGCESCSAYGFWNREYKEQSNE